MFVDADELQWVVPASIVPSVLGERLNVVDQFLKNPIDLQGKKASEMLSKKARRHRRRRSPSLGSDVELLDDEPEPRRRKKEKKKKEEKKYKSAQFIEDSDEEYGDMEAFLEREKAQREKTALAAAESGKIPTMKATGTKKRRKKGKDVVLSSAEDDPLPVASKTFSDDSNSEDEILMSLRRSRSPSPAPKTKTRPKPRVVRKSKTTAAAEAINISSDSEPQVQPREESTSPILAVLRPGKKGRVVLSDDEV